MDNDQWMDGWTMEDVQMNEGWMNRGWIMDDEQMDGWTDDGRWMGGWFSDFNCLLFNLFIVYFWFSWFIFLCVFCNMGVVEICFNMVIWQFRYEFCLVYIVLNDFLKVKNREILYKDLYFSYLWKRVVEGFFLFLKVIFSQSEVVVFLAGFDFSFLQFLLVFFGFVWFKQVSQISFESLCM